LIRLLVLALFRRLRQSADIEELKVSEVTVDTPRRMVTVAVDGEVLHMTPPLRYRTRPGALRVLVPTEDAARTPAK
jgi:diacylglycerol kinase family enzyme